jgi:hypothetical protein
MMRDVHNEWGMYLDHADMLTNDAGAPTFITGWFMSVRPGPRTELMNLVTSATRDNPKVEHEGEKLKTHFLIRLADGLFLLDSYGGNVVTAAKVTSYFEDLARPTLDEHQTHFITLEKLVSSEFLENLGRLDVIRLAKVRVEVDENTHYQDDALGHFERASSNARGSYVDLAIGKLNAKKNGLERGGVRAFFTDILGRHNVIAGTIEGRAPDGTDTTLKLHGIEEKHRHQFDTDAFGEVLSAPLIEYMMTLGVNHPQI